MTQSKILKTNTANDDYIVIDDMLVDKKMHDIAQKIDEYDEQLCILCVDPDSCTFSEAPFVLAEVVNTPQGPQVFKVFEFWELNDSVLQRLYASDTRRTNVLADIDKNNQRVRDESERRYREKIEAKKDVVASIVASMKSSYSYIDEDRDAKVTMYEDRPPKVEMKD
jgi:hypothetical protein